MVVEDEEIFHRRRNYKARVLDETGNEREIIVTSPGAAKLLPACRYSIDLACSIVGDKYLMHLPLERQKRAMESQGLANVSVKTLWNLCWAVGGHLEPVAEKIRREILGAGLCVHADETPWPIQGEKDDNGYLWSISNMAGSYYRFEPTRSGKVIEEMLGEYRGPLLSDGYGGYNRLERLEGIELSHCWAHARRKFFDIEEAQPQAAREVLELIDDLFAIERRACTMDELKLLRAAESAALIDKIRRWCEEMYPACLPSSPMRKAIEYTMKRWTGLTRFLDDVRVPLSNNDAERTLRHAVVGRKNYYGSKTINGADLAATLFTVIDSCKRVALDPRSYLAMAVHSSACGEEPPTPMEYAQKTRAPQA